MDGRTISGKISLGGGGVGRNIADALGKMGIDPFLITAIGEEEFGEFVTKQTLSHLDAKGIVKLPDVGTGACVILCDHTGECLLVVGDMDIHGKITVEHVKRHKKRIVESSLIVLDGNLREDTLEFVLKLCQESSVPVWYEPTDIYKADKPFKKKNIPLPNFISPNYQEFLKIYEAIFPNAKNIKNMNLVEDCVSKGTRLSHLIDNIIITLGKDGVVVIRKGQASDSFFNESKYIRWNGNVSHRLYKPEMVPKEDVINVSGAGDCFASGFIAAMLKGYDEKTCVEFGLKCSKASLKCNQPVPPKFV